MNLTKRTIAATFAALLIGGFGISPASAAVSTNSGKVDINRIVQELELQNLNLNETPFHPNELVAPQDNAQLARQSQPQPEV